MVCHNDFDRTTMANRIVLGGIAAAAGLYAVKENYEQHLVRIEREEKEYEAKKILLELARKRNEEQQQDKYRKQQQKGIGRNKRVTISEEIMIAVVGKCQDYLCDIVTDVKAKARVANTSIREQTLNLPLLDMGNNSPDEIAFGASLLFGNNQVVDSSIKASVVELKPEHVIAQLTNNSSKIIKNVLECNVYQPVAITLYQKTKRSKHKNRNGKEEKREIQVDLSHISLDTLNKVAGFVVGSYGESHNSRNRPKIFTSIKLRDAQEFEALKVCIDALGFYLYLQKCWTSPLPTDRGIEYRFDCEYLDAQSGDSIWITNFPGRAFYVPNYKIERVIERDGSQRIGYDLSFIKNQQPIHKGWVFNHILDGVNGLSLTSEVLARCVVSRTVSKSLELLNSFGRDPIYLEHIAVRAGYYGDILRTIRTGTADIIADRDTNLFRELEQQLLQSVPPPDRDWSEYWHKVNNCNTSYDFTQDERDYDGDVMWGYADINSASRSYVQLESDIHLFTRKYERLLELNYCLVPIQGGLRPSECVPERPLYDLAISSMCQSRFKFPVQTITRDLKIDERKRFMKSCEISLPPTDRSAVCLFILLSIFFLISYEVMCRIPIINTLGNALFIGTTLFSTVTGLLLPTIGYIDGVLHVQHDRDAGRFQMLWTTIAYLTERILRGVSVLRGLGTPFEKEIRDLTLFCRDKQRIWTKRCCQRDYYKALNRKKIDAKELNRLIMYMAEEVNNGHAMEGTFPGGMSDGKRFLDLQVETSDDLTKSGDDNYGSSWTEFSSLTQIFESKIVMRVSVSKRSLFFLNKDRVAKAQTDIGQALILHSGTSLTGTVVAVYSDITLVRFDGESGVLPVLSKICTFLPPSSKEEEKRGNGGGCDEDFFDDHSVHVDEVFNEDKEQKALKRAKRRQFVSRSRKIRQQLGKEPPVVHTKKKKKKTANTKDGLDQVANICKNDFVQANDEADEEVIPGTKYSKKGKSTKIKGNRSVLDVLKSGGWELIRRKNHLVYRRKISPSNGDEEVRDGPSHQTFTMSKTPSDWRSSRNSLSRLRRLDKERYKLHADADADERRKRHEYF